MSVITTLVETGNALKLAEKLEELSRDKFPCNELSQMTESGHTPLALAALLGRQDILLTLLKYGAEVNAANRSGYTAIHYSAAWGKLECLRTLVNNGGNHYFFTNSNKDTPRDLALRYNQTPCVTYFDFLDMRNQLEEAVSKARQILGDSDRVSGKWNKEDRSKVAAMCNETVEWIAKNKGTTVEKMQEQKDDFEMKLEPYLDKLI